MKKHTQNNFLAYLVVLASFFILIFFTKDIYGTIQEQSDNLERQRVELTSNKNELTRLGKLQQDLLAEDSQVDKEIKGFTGDFTDENIINHIYSYAQEVNLGSERILVREISLSDGEKSDLGFMKAAVNLDIITSSEETLFGFLNFLTDEESDFRFYITNFDYNLGEKSGNITVNIPLIFYYK